jgi:hypothetical protein
MVGLKEKKISENPDACLDFKKIPVLVKFD